MSLTDPAVIGFFLVVIALTSLWIGAFVDLFTHWQARTQRMLWLFVLLLIPLLGYILYFSFGRGRVVPARGVSFTGRKGSNDDNEIGAQVK